MSPNLHFDFNRLGEESSREDKPCQKSQFIEGEEMPATVGSDTKVKVEGHDDDSKETTFQTSQQQLIERVVDKLCRSSSKTLLSLPAHLEEETAVTCDTAKRPMVSEINDNSKDENLQKTKPRSCGVTCEETQDTEKDDGASRTEFKSEVQNDLGERADVKENEASNVSYLSRCSDARLYHSPAIKHPPVLTHEAGPHKDKLEIPLQQPVDVLSSDNIEVSSDEGKPINPNAPPSTVLKQISEKSVVSGVENFSAAIPGIQNVVGIVDASRIENCDSDEVAAAVGLLSLPFKAVVSPTESLESGEEAEDGDQGMASQMLNMNSEGRRSSSRACKGQRYREFMMEGGLTKGRKGRRGIFK